MSDNIFSLKNKNINTVCPCQNGGICGISFGTCDCTGTGFTGHECATSTTDVPTTSDDGGEGETLVVCPGPCETCDYDGADLICLTCATGFTLNSDYECIADICDPNPCQNGGICTISGASNSWICDCSATGFTGDECTISTTDVPTTSDNDGFGNDDGDQCDIDIENFLGCFCEGSILVERPSSKRRPRSRYNGNGINVYNYYAHKEPNVVDGSVDALNPRIVVGMDRLDNIEDLLQDIVVQNKLMKISLIGLISFNVIVVALCLCNNIPSFRPANREKYDMVDQYM